MLLCLVAEIDQDGHTELERFFSEAEVEPEFVGAGAPVRWRGPPLRDRIFSDGRTSGFAAAMDGKREHELRRWLAERGVKRFRFSRGRPGETAAHNFAAYSRGRCSECGESELLYLAAFDREERGDQIGCSSCGGMFAPSALLPSSLLHIAVPSGDGDETSICFDPALLGDEFYIGRAPARARLCIRDATVARRHCKIKRHNGVFWVIDASSSGGTYVNDNRIRQPHALVSGDVISAGIELRVTVIDR